jgi:hypothetical protein
MKKNIYFMANQNYIFYGEPKKNKLENEGQDSGPMFYFANIR